MSRITNSKIGFKYFPGFSILFDNPGKKTLCPFGNGGNILKMNCLLEEEARLDLYAKLHLGLRKIKTLEDLRRKYLFFELPQSSLHVTVWDGLNHENKRSIDMNYWNDVETFLLGIPYSLLDDCKFTEIPKNSPVFETDMEITFVFDKLAVWGDSVLVAQLKPSDNKSLSTSNKIEAQREKLYKRFQKKFGLSDWFEFSPHIALGYFGNKETAQLFKLRSKHWNKIFKSYLIDSSITFESMAIYGFTDMENFFRV